MRILFNWAKYQCNPPGKAWILLYAAYSLYLNRFRSPPNDLRKKSFSYYLPQFAVTESRISIHSSACDDIVLHVPEKAINHPANYLFLMVLRRNALYPSILEEAKRGLALWASAEKIGLHLQYWRLLMRRRYSEWLRQAGLFDDEEEASDRRGCSF